MNETTKPTEWVADADGRVERVWYRAAPLDYSAVLGAKDPALAAAVAWLHDHGSAFGLTEAQLPWLTQKAGGSYKAEVGERYVRGTDMGRPPARAVGFVRTVCGLPVRGEGLVVHTRRTAERLEVVAAGRARGGPVQVEPVAAAKLKEVVGGAESFARDALGKAGAGLLGEKGVTVVSATPCIVRVLSHRGGDPEAAPWSALPKLPGSLPVGRYTLAVDVAFTGAAAPLLGGLAHVVVAVPSGAVVRLELPAAGATIAASTWTWDPITRGTGPALTLTSSAALLDAQREPVTLTVTTANTLVSATTLAYDTDLGAPHPPPTGASLAPSVPSIDGGMLAAFANVEDAFARVADLGFSLPDFFAGQVAGSAWPLLVDGVHPGEIGLAVAYANRATQLCFGQNGGQLWGGLDRRIVFHEVFGHVVLLNRTGSSGLGFAHSFGDALAAIFADVDLPDRAEYRTFPFSRPAGPDDFDLHNDSLARRHDRVPAPGKAWGWGAGSTPAPNSHDDYREEQKLSSTCFRLYRALGGDSTNATVRRTAARTTAWLLLQTAYRTHGLALPATPEAFAGDMRLADSDPWPAMGWVGGAYHKVVRWAFERQGAYTSPVSTEAVGKPPAVDVFVANARHGEYGYASTWGTTTGIWNRHAADGGTVDEAPLAGKTNYLYVRLGNRGTTAASGAVVRVYLGKVGANAKFPTDFVQIGKRIGKLMVAASFPAPVVPAGDLGTVVVGPIPWVPKSTFLQPVLAVVDHPEDRPNTVGLTVAAPMEASRLVPHDNNTGIRTYMLLKLGLSDFFLAQRFGIGVPLRGDASGAAVELEHQGLSAAGEVVATVTETAAVPTRGTRVHRSTLLGAALKAAGAVDVVTVVRSAGVVHAEVRWRR